jgi:hypothetical protein
VIALFPLGRIVATPVTIEGKATCRPYPGMPGLPQDLAVRRLRNTHRS